jgi:uncharacterized protein YjbI with pentapeptide repeats
MAKPEHLAKLKEGLKAWNQWRNDNPNVRPDLNQAHLENASLQRLDLSYARLSHASLMSADLGNVNLLGANLSQANLSHANLYRAKLHLAVLTGANFSRAKLNVTDLSDCIAYGADFVEAELTNASLYNASLVRSNFLRAKIQNCLLRGSDFSDGDLGSANFQGADLSGVNFTRAHLNDVVFGAEVDMGQTVLADVDLREVHGLETILHLGPSTIGIDTIYKSRGKIPHAFLRGAGVPEFFIENMAGLAGVGIEFYSLFISYSTKDQAFADRLHADLQAKGVRCWFAPHEMLGGKKVFRQIDEAIRMYDKLLLILSPASMESEWVRTEIAIARKREKEQDREVLFPIALCPFKRIKEWEYFDSDIGKDSAREIREYHIPTFTKWKTDQDAYQKEFSKLLKALQGKAKPIGA